MKRNAKRFLGVLLALLMLLSLLPASALAEAEGTAPDEAPAAEETTYEEEAPAEDVLVVEAEPAAEEEPEAAEEPVTEEEPVIEAGPAAAEEEPALSQDGASGSAAYIGPGLDKVCDYHAIVLDVQYDVTGSVTRTVTVAGEEKSKTFPLYGNLERYFFIQWVYASGMTVDGVDVSGQVVPDTGDSCAIVERDEDGLNYRYDGIRGPWDIGRYELVIKDENDVVLTRVPFEIRECAVHPGYADASPLTALDFAPTCVTFGETFDYWDGVSWTTDEYGDPIEDVSETTTLYYCEDCGSWFYAFDSGTDFTPLVWAEEYCRDIFDLFEFYRFNTAPLGHHYVDGACVRCGRAEPTYRPVEAGESIVPGAKYILIGTTADGTRSYILGDGSDGGGGCVPVTFAADSTVVGPETVAVADDGGVFTGDVAVGRYAPGVPMEFSFRELNDSEKDALRERALYWYEVALDDTALGRAYVPDSGWQGHVLHDDLSLSRETLINSFNTFDLWYAGDVNRYENACFAFLGESGEARIYGLDSAYINAYLTEWDPEYYDEDYEEDAHVVFMDDCEWYPDMFGNGYNYIDDFNNVTEVRLYVASGHDEHTWNEGAVTKEATCVDEGIKTYTCADCGATRTEAIPANGHTPASYTAVPPTCTETGLTDGQYCLVCGEDIVPREIIAALGHDWGDWTVTKEATVDEEGVETRVCRNDESHIETRPIPKLPRGDADGNGTTEDLDAALVLQYVVGLNNGEGFNWLLADANGDGQVTILDVWVILNLIN